MLLQSLGAEAPATRVMAAQILKRADQLAAERGASRYEAIDYLVRVTIAGREGRVYDGPLPGNPATVRAGGQKKG